MYVASLIAMYVAIYSSIVTSGFTINNVQQLDIIQASLDNTSCVLICVVAIAKHKQF